MENKINSVDKSLAETGLNQLMDYAYPASENDERLK